LKDAHDFLSLSLSISIIIVLEWEYQYHLKDHLGNTRLTITSQEKTQEVQATMEASREEEEWSEFLYYDEAVKINTKLFDYTRQQGGTHYSQRLSGRPGERTGLAKSMAVMPGDRISAEVFAKFVDPERSNWDSRLQEVMAAIQSQAGGVGADGRGLASESFPLAGLLCLSPLKEWRVFGTKFRNFKLGKHEQIVQEME
jgi:hypothetical protein